MTLGGRGAMAIVAAATMVLAAEQYANAQVACPATIAVEEKAAAPNQWSLGYSTAPAELSSVTIFDGAPEEQASLKYDDERTTRDEIIQTWALPASDRGYWIVCGYTNTTAQLRRKLPDDDRACQVAMEKGVSYGGGGAVIKRARCVPAGAAQKNAAH
jgi:methionine-rich copper-binding protein CopC